MPHDEQRDILLGRPSQYAEVTETKVYADRTALSGGAAALDVVRVAKEHNLIAKNGLELMLAELIDPDSDYAQGVREDILEREQAAGPQAQYSVSGGARAGLTVLEAGTGQADSVAGMGLGLVAGAVTRNPGVAIGAAKAATGILGFGTSAGGAYLEYSRSRTDDGKLVDPHIAAGAAFLTGVAETSIELVTFGGQVKALGGLADAAAKGGAREWFKKALADRTTRELFRDLGKTIAKNAAVEGGEEFAQESAGI